MNNIQKLFKNYSFCIQKLFNYYPKYAIINKKRKWGKKMSKLVKKFEKEKYDLAKKYINEGKISKGLRYLTEDILILLNKGLTKKEVLEIINDELKVNIKEQSFYTFCNRSLNKIDTNTKSNVKGVEKVKETKPKKEVKNEVSEVKSKKVNPVKILNDNSITATDNKYKDLL